MNGILRRMNHSSINTNQYTLKTLHNLAELATYAEQWDQLCQSLPHKNPLMGYAWLSTYFEYCTTDFAQWRVLLAFEQDQLVALLPVILIQARKYGLTYQEISLPFNSETMSVDMLVHQGHGQDLYDALYQAAFRAFPKARCLHLRRIDGVSASLQHTRGHLYVQEFIENGASLRNNQSYAERKTALPKNFKSNLSKARNKLEREGACTFAMGGPTPPAQQMQSVIDTELLSWKGPAGSAIACSEKNVQFYLKVAENLARQGHLCVHTLTLGEKVIAANMGILYAGNLLLWKLGYDEAYRKLSPGGILIEELLKEVENNPQIERIDLMTNEDWYNNWNMQWRPFYDLYIYPRHPVAVLLAGLQKAKIIAKRLLKRGA